MRTSNTTARLVRHALATLLCLYVLGASWRAAAQGSPDVPGYRQAIEDAVAEHDAHNYLEAKALFARAHVLYPNARTLRGLGAMSFELKQYAEAVSYLEQALASRERPLTGELRDETERLLARARAFVAELRIELQLRVLPANEPTPRAADPHMLIDGVDETYEADKPMRLPVGEHELEFRADGYRTERRRYVVQGGETKRWVITLQPVEDGAPNAPAEPPVDRVLRVKRIKRGLGGTLLGLGVGAFAGALATNSKRHARENDFANTIEQSMQYKAAYPRWTDARAAPYAWGGVSAGLLTAGAVTLLTSVERSKFPLWASLSSAAAGIGLAAWGLSDVARGHASCNPLDVRPCAVAQERRDRGALVTMFALPLLAVPLAQLFRRSTPSERAARYTFYPDAGARQLGVNAMVRWY